MNLSTVAAALNTAAAHVGLAGFHAPEPRLLLPHDASATDAEHIEFDGILLDQREGTIGVFIQTAPDVFSPVAFETDLGEVTACVLGLWVGRKVNGLTLTPVPSPAPLFESA